MLEAGTMLLFCAVLFASVALGWSIIPALFVGALLFMGYGLVRRPQYYLGNSFAAFCG